MRHVHIRTDATKCQVSVKNSAYPLRSPNPMKLCNKPLPCKKHAAKVKP